MNISKLIQNVLWSALLLTCTCTRVQSQEKVKQEVDGFIQLLIKADVPTLAEYARFSSEGAELELLFELKECHLRGWEDKSKLCVNFIQNRWRSADQQPTFFLGWLRKQFSTVGKSYHLVGVESKTEGFSHDLVEVNIGENRFLLFHNTDPNKPTGVIVDVSEVNGKNINFYFKEGKINGGK